ncbi:unnamed protein product [Penicillium glandicola]
MSWYRLMRESDTKYRLTGINQVQHRQGPFYNPTDPTIARISGKKNPKYDDQVFTQFNSASIGRQPREYKGKTIGYFVHAHCWALFGRVEGLKINHASLAKFILVCRKYWKNNELWEISDYVHWFSIDRDKVASNLKYDWDIYQNPLIVPAIQEALDCAEIKCHHPSQFSNIPLEVAILISERVCPIIDYTVDDIKDTRNMLIEFGWELPEWFWRARLNEHLFFELNKLSKKGSSKDGQLRLDLMSLVADQSRFASSGLANRERVLATMFALDKAYTEQLKKKSI